MECCSICCFKYSEPNSSDNKFPKKLCCSHCLCMSCYLKLDKTYCPFCRSTFKYTKEELDIRKSMNLDYNKWQPPSQITNYIPIPRVRNRNRQALLPNSIVYENTQAHSINNFNINEPYSRLRKNMKRKRRKNLTFEEVLARRKNIRKRCQRSWNKKNRRRSKETNELF